MTDSTRPKVLILETDTATAQRAETLLKDRGCDVVCETRPKSALGRLKQAGNAPFHLFISNFERPEITGDDILKHAKTISPLTRRMLTVSADRPDRVIQAINKAGIHACIVTPAADQELVEKVWTCIEDFKRDMKQRRLQRVVTHQNKQMFGIAQRLKKKDKRCKAQLNALKKEKLRLKAILSQARHQKKDPVTLEDRVNAHDIEIAPHPLDQEFQKLSRVIKSLFDSIILKTGTTVSFEDISEIIQDLPSNIASHQQAPSAPPPPESAQAPDPTREEFVHQVLRTVFSSPRSPAPDTSEDEQTPLPPKRLEDLVGIRKSQDGVQAFIWLEAQPEDPALLSLTGLLDLLRKRGISFGIVEDRFIDAWLANAHPGQDEFPVAQGEAPIFPVDGSVDYEFQIDYTNPGKIMEDGSMDFKDRGDIPFVKTGDLLAVKTPAKQGQSGMTVSGDVIAVADADDPVILAGSGTILSEDGLFVHAATEGQPHLAPMGELSVNPELLLRGDVDYETGNVEFNGNIVVKGTVKDGFTVKGVSLTAKEIQGGVIDLSGDLCVTDGITDAEIVSVGNVYAKFINNSKVNAFGNVVVQKEIIDSDIILSGSVENPSGVIMSSKIAAKTGVEAGRIGTDTSKPAHLRVGVDAHVETRLQDIDAHIEASRDRQVKINNKMAQVEEKDQALYSQITEKAQEQERLQNQIEMIRTALMDLKQHKDQVGLDQALGDIQKLSAALKKTDQELNTIFRTQDSHAKKVETYKAAMDDIETFNKTLILKKKALKNFSKKTEPHPIVIVNKSITQETVVMGPNTSLTLNLDLKRCRIEEKTIEADGLNHFKMEIVNL